MGSLATGGGPLRSPALSPLQWAVLQSVRWLRQLTCNGEGWAVGFGLRDEPGESVRLRREAGEKAGGWWELRQAGRHSQIHVQSCNKQHSRSSVLFSCEFSLRELGEISMLLIKALVICVGLIRNQKKRCQKEGGKWEGKWEVIGKRCCWSSPLACLWVFTNSRLGAGQVAGVEHKSGALRPKGQQICGDLCWGPIQTWTRRPELASWVALSTERTLHPSIVLKPCIVPVMSVHVSTSNKLP